MDKSLQVHRVHKGRGYTSVQMDICKGEKSQGTLGREGARVHQVTDGHLQRTSAKDNTKLWSCIWRLMAQGNVGGGWLW